MPMLLKRLRWDTTALHQLAKNMNMKSTTRAPTAMMGEMIANTVKP